MSKTMPIGGFWGPVRVPDTPYKGASKDLIQDEIYALIKGAGINYISFIERDYVTETDEVISNLELAGKYGIGLLMGIPLFLELPYAMSRGLRNTVKNPRISTHSRNWRRRLISQRIWPGT